MPKWAKDEVQEATGGLLPEGLATVKVTGMEEIESSTGKFGLKVETKVTGMNVAGKDAPQYKGQTFRFSFYIGTNDDPGANEKATWTASFAAKRYKSFLKAARIGISGNTEEECETAPGAELSVQIKHRKYTDNAGNERTTAEADSFYPVGMANGLDTTVKRVAAAPVRRAAVTEYVEDGE